MKLTEAQRYYLVRMLGESKTGTHIVARMTGKALKRLGLAEGGYQGRYALTEKGRQVANVLAKDKSVNHAYFNLSLHVDPSQPPRRLFDTGE